MAFMRQPPPPVYQSNTWWCWAACLEILNRAHPDKFPPPVRNQSEWMEAMRAAPAASRLLNEHGGLNTHYLPSVLNAIGMVGQQWAGPPTAPPDITFIEQQLRVSYLLALYPVPGGSHFVVIYGVDRQRVHYFNPMTGVGNTSATHAQVRAGRLVIAWKP